VVSLIYFYLVLRCCFLRYVGGDVVADVIALILDGDRLMELASAIPASRYFCRSMGVFERSV
jgi:hypothetical protein